MSVSPSISVCDVSLTTSWKLEVRSLINCVCSKDGAEFKCQSWILQVSVIVILPLTHTANDQLLLYTRGDIIVTLFPRSPTRGDAYGKMRNFYRSFNLSAGHGAQPKVFLFRFPPSSIFIQQGYCFVITQQRRMTGDVIFTISLQFLQMKAIDFPPFCSQKKRRSPAAQPSIEWLMKKTIWCIIEYCDWSLLNSLCITVWHTELITMQWLFCVKQTELFFFEHSVGFCTVGWDLL